MARELQELCAALDALRAGFLKKLAGLAEVGDANAPMKRPQGKARNLRAALLVVIEETARHAGHADIIREQIDGRTGR